MVDRTYLFGIDQESRSQHARIKVSIGKKGPDKDREKIVAKKNQCWRCGWD